jgi:hypothetical protein
MTGATASIILLFKTGINLVSLIASAIIGALMVISIVVFRNHPLKTGTSGEK